MTMANQRDDRNLEEFAQFPERSRQNSGCPAERVPCFRIYHGDIAVFNHLAQLANQHGIVGEFTLTDTAHLTQQFFPTDEAVNGNNVI